MMFKPMLCSIGNKKLLEKKNYLFEPKLDGYRALLYKNKEIKLISRNGNDITKNYPELKLEKNINSKNAVIDGEIVIFEESGRPNFNLMQQRQENPNKVLYPATYVAFDILMKDNKLITLKPIEKRKEILNEVIKESSSIQINPYTDNGSELWKEIEKLKLEGVIAKKKKSTYQQYRSSDWVKIKNILTLDGIIIGYTSKKRKISSLALGLFHNNKIHYIGKVGTGFDEEMLVILERKLTKLKPIKAVNKNKEIKWVTPKYIAEIKFLEMTKDKILRAPSFVRLRDDKKIKECTFNQLIV